MPWVAGMPGQRLLKQQPPSAAPHGFHETSDLRRASSALLPTSLEVMRPAQLQPSVHPSVQAAADAVKPAQSLKHAPVSRLMQVSSDDATAEVPNWGTSLLMGQKQGAKAHLRGNLLPSDALTHAAMSPEQQHDDEGVLGSNDNDGSAWELEAPSEGAASSHQHEPSAPEADWEPEASCRQLPSGPWHEPSAPLQAASAEGAGLQLDPSTSESFRSMGNIAKGSNARGLLENAPGFHDWMQLGSARPQGFGSTASGTEIADGGPDCEAAIESAHEGLMRSCSPVSSPKGRIQYGQASVGTEHYNR